MRPFFLLPLLFMLCYGYSQQTNFEQYDSLINKAYQLYKMGDYAESAATYSAGFMSIGGKAYTWDRYNAACSFSLAEKPDSAFHHLFRLAEGKAKFSDLIHLTNDADLSQLHADSRWDKLVNIVAENKKEAEKDFDHELIGILDTVLLEDQKYRMEIEKVKEEFGWESAEMKAHFQIMKEKDSINLIKVCKILDERGWLGPHVIGENGSSALFLVIQHAPTDVQLNYLPMMREAVANGNAYSSDLALLEDRVALAQGKKQVYGSQIGFDEETETYYVLPIENAEEVNQRRAEVGLGTIEEYAGRWEIVWNVETHKKRSVEN